MSDFNFEIVSKEEALKEYQSHGGRSGSSKWEEFLQPSLNLEQGQSITVVINNYNDVSSLRSYLERHSEVERKVDGSSGMVPRIAIDSKKTKESKEAGHESKEADYFVMIYPKTEEQMEEDLRAKREREKRQREKEAAEEAGGDGAMTEKAKETVANFEAE